MCIRDSTKIQGQPIGYNFNAPLPNGVTTFVFGYAGNRQKRLSSDRRIHVHAQGELRSSMTIVSPPSD
eukprot:701354-Pyramimonas_sp.AAC.1